VGRYQKGKTNLDFTKARDSQWQWQWHQLGHMQVCTSLQADNHVSTPPLSFLPPNQQCQSTEGISTEGIKHIIGMEMQIKHYIKSLIFTVKHCILLLLSTSSENWAGKYQKLKVNFHNSKLFITDTDK